MDDLFSSVVDAVADIAVALRKNAAEQDAGAGPAASSGEVDCPEKAASSDSMSTQDVHRLVEASFEDAASAPPRYVSGVPQSTASRVTVPCTNAVREYLYTMNTTTSVLVPLAALTQDESGVCRVKLTGGIAAAARKHLMQEEAVDFINGKAPEPDKKDARLRKEEAFQELFPGS